MRYILFLAMALLFSGQPVFAELDQESQDALKDTQDLLQNQQRLLEAGKTSPNAQKALEQMSAISGKDPKLQEEILKMSSDVFTKMVQDTNGDSSAIESKLQKGLKDPKSMLQYFSPEQLAKIEEMARQIEAKKRSPSSK